MIPPTTALLGHVIPRRVYPATSVRFSGLAAALVLALAACADAPDSGEGGAASDVHGEPDLLGLELSGPGVTQLHVHAPGPPGDHPGPVAREDLPVAAVQGIGAGAEQTILIVHGRIGDAPDAAAGLDRPRSLDCPRPSLRSSQID